MSRFDLAEKVKKEELFKEEQRKLKEKYNIDEKVVVVEKSNTYKFTIRTLTAGLRLCASIILITLALIGLATLVYPQIRQEFILILQEVLFQLQQMIKF